MRIEGAAALTAVLACWLGCPRAPDPPVQRRPVATVDGVGIEAQELRREVWRQAGAPAAGQPERLALVRALLDHAIEQQVLLAAARAAGTTVSAEEVDSALAGNRDGYRAEDYAAAVHAHRLTPPEIRRRLEERLIVEKYLDGRTRDAVKVTDEAVARYYEQNLAAYKVPAQVRARQVVVRTQEEARVILARLARGEDFGRVAREHSVAPEKDRGGDLGFFSPGTMPQVFDEACFKLEPGQLSDVVASEYGHHVFQVTERRAEQQQPLEAVRDRVRAELVRAQREEAEGAVLADIRRKARVEVDEEVLRWVADQDVPVPPAPAGGRG